MQEQKLLINYLSNLKGKLPKKGVLNTSACRERRLEIDTKGSGSASARLKSSCPCLLLCPAAAVSGSRSQSGSGSGQNDRPCMDFCFNYTHLGPHTRTLTGTHSEAIIISMDGRCARVNLFICLSLF